jgi:pimeloyl-ACP methyl ester carboxylesterase
MIRGWLWLAVLLLPAVATAQERVELPTRPGVVQPLLVTAVAHPVASVVLFPGGSGVVAEMRANFLLRVAPAFVAQGMTVAIADVPSDRPHGMEPAFRASEAHARDIAAIVDWLRARAAVPVWLVGTSRGTISAANGAVAIGPPRVAGVVLTSTVWMGGIALVPLERIRVPVLVVHNRDDGCHESPFQLAEPAMARLVQAPAKQLILVSGGLARSDPCQAMSRHGYLGIEDQVVAPVIAWIRAHPGG